ncbi:acyl-CoA dehydrogenase family protein [Pseudonocardia eucalypti]|uniref:Acyl-CoA dehydrogenase family protein n=1 Tax=Pseudonocardia eucalypti TaxID=648755 RepID=A0ABP9R2C6_9PSEU|nr:alkylation response protein AidB-like acyl-CoA dehydrogenase [Pseudonocardia eucalypti]
MSDRATVERLVKDFLSEHPVESTPDRELRAARFDAGLAFVHHEKGHGGLGLDSSLNGVVEQMFLDAGAKNWSGFNVIGLGMAAPTVYVHGTEEQRRKYLKALFTGEEIWCQLFSEPGAGSDLASLATRAVPDGDHYIVNGQKVWTSLGHVARRGLLVARTDPDLPKHRGLTYFIVDMKAPGVEVRPLRQITGQAEFNEVYFNDAAVPEADRLGAVGEGWRVSMTTLMNERVSIGRRRSRRGEGPISEAIKAFRAAAAAGTTDAATRDKLMSLWTRAEAARLTNVRAAAQAGVGTPGPEGSIAKLQFAELNKAILELCVDLQGTDGMLINDYTMAQPDHSTVSSPEADIRKTYLRSLANSIEGGTSEVMRNILGERVLGLPGEPRTDRDLPWKDVPRS